MFAATNQGTRARGRREFYAAHLVREDWERAREGRVGVDDGKGEGGGFFGPAAPGVAGALACRKAVWSNWLKSLRVTPAK